MAIHPDYVAASFDCLLHDLMCGKRGLAEAALWPTGDVPEDIGELLDGLALAPSGDRSRVPDAATGQTHERVFSYKPMIFCI